MRRAEYLGGAGVLSVGNGRLLFVCDGRHSAVEDLERAANSERPAHALSAIMGKVERETPPFVFAAVGDRMQGIVFGSVQLEIDDGDVLVTVDGATADPWANFDAAASSTLTCGGREFQDTLWVASGVVRAGCFRWRHSRSGGVELDGSVLTESTSTKMVAVGSPPDTNDLAPVSSRVKASLLDSLNSEFDATTDAIRFAEVRSKKDNQEGSWRRRREDRGGLEPAVTRPASKAAPDDEDEDMVARSQGPSCEHDATIDLTPGQILLDSLNVERRTVEALVCLGCDNPNPPATVLCRYCTTLLSSMNTEVREVPQPVLGVIHLSGGREELLDTDLLIGRNPGYLPLKRYQRAVVHAEQDRSVSRRQIELRLEQWKVMAINLKQGTVPIVESSAGRRTKLLPGVPQHLKAGDTVHYGGAWLRFEPEE